MKVFSKEKFIKVEGYKDYLAHRKWVNECDGKPVRGGMCGKYCADDAWCIDVPEAVNCKCVVKTREGQKGEKKMYTMKDFKEKRIAVRVGKEHMTEFLRMCDAEGLRWRSGERAAKFTPMMFVDENTCVTLHCKYGSGKLMNGSRKVCKEQGLTIVDFNDFVTQTTQPRYRIVIECDGTTTTARMEINGKEVKTAQAKRNPADKFDWRVGAETAFGRLFGKKIEKPEEKKERPFEVGDRVVCVFPTDYKHETVGKHGRVIAIEPECDKDRRGVCVEFDKHIDGHDCRGRGKYGHCWNCGKETLRHE